MRSHISQRVGRSAARNPAIRLAAPASRRALRQKAEIRGLLGRPAIQAKLRVGAVNDPLEREADRVADRVMQMPGPEAGPRIGQAASGVQRLCAECEDELQIQSAPDEAVQRQVEEEEEELLQTKRAEGEIQRQVEEEEEELIQPKAEGVGQRGFAVDDATVSGIGAGRPLDPGLRAFFEPRFGVDFSAVRVHREAGAAASARSLGARAYTWGRHVVLGQGEYRPESPSGKHLLAHELTHVVQQTKPDKRSGRRTGDRDTGPKRGRIGGQPTRNGNVSGAGRPGAAMPPRPASFGGPPGIQRLVVDDDVHVTCRGTRANSVTDLQTAETDAIGVARLAAVLARLHVASHPIAAAFGESPGLANFRDILWRRFHFDYNDPVVRDTLVPLIARRLELVADWISRLRRRYHCAAPGAEPPGECINQPGVGVAWTATGSSRTDLCDAAWVSAQERSATVLHEWLHFGFGWLGDCEQARNRNNTVCYEMFARELAGVGTAADFRACCAPPADPLPPFVGGP